MNNNKRLLIWGLIVVFLLIVLISFLLIKLSPREKKEEFSLPPNRLSVFNAIPIDAVAVFDFKEYQDIRHLFNDTTSFLYGLIDNNNGLVDIQKTILSNNGDKNSSAFSLHYSAKNNVSLLQIINIDSNMTAIDKNLFSDNLSKRRYNGKDIFNLSNGVYVAKYDNLLLLSTSSYVLEGSIRHLNSNISILNNENFISLLEENGNDNGVYINNGQIGKFFSGVIANGYLKFSDFFLKFSAWSYMKLDDFYGGINLKGKFLNNLEKFYNSSVYAGLDIKESYMGKILPSTTIFAISFPISNLNKLTKQQDVFWEVQKRLNLFNNKKDQLKKQKGISPMKWIDSLNVEEVISAYCKLGDKCEWITLFREKQKFGLNNVVSSVIENNKTNDLQEYSYKGYMESIFGKIFSYCPEEYICKIGEWSIIGSKQFVNEFVVGNAYFFNLEEYISQTPSSGYLSKESVVKMVINLKEAGDTLTNIFKPYGKSCISNQLTRNNFEFITLDILPDKKEVTFDANIYATILKEIPKPTKKEENKGATFIVDSTIVLPSGPYLINDVSLKSDAYLEQLPNKRLRYLDKNKKGIWAIPFDTEICGYVEQIDLFNNGKLQMMFLSENKVYLLDRVGRFVNGYPKKLKKDVVMGPKLIKGLKGNRYSFVALNKDNTISWYSIDGKGIDGWKDIKAPEFIKELPEIEKIDGKWYWILRAPSTLYLYDINGKLIKLEDKKRVISRDSDINVISQGKFKVKCTDGKEYSWDINSGKLKKI